LRPLRRGGGGPEEAISRRHELVDHGKEGGPAGLYSVVGGKLSTFRPLAREVVQALGRRVITRSPRSVVDAVPAGVDAVAEHLARYGPAAAGVLAAGPELLCPHTGAVEGEVTHAIRGELAVTLSDVLMRRIGITWASCRGLCCHERAAAIAAGPARWSPERLAAEVRAFEADVDRHLPSLTSIRGGKGAAA
jgi:glycerol-3-phosphate dehydrogenase